MFFGSLLKVAYAFLWQEVFVPFGFMYNEFGITFGAMGMAYLNHNLNHFSGIKQTDDRINKFLNVYPGDTLCRLQSPHAIWHEESANGLLEFFFMNDKMSEIFSTATYVDPI
jgi:hypothetical protein